MEKFTEFSSIMPCGAAPISQPMRATLCGDHHGLSFYNPCGTAFSELCQVAYYYDRSLGGCHPVPPTGNGGTGCLAAGKMADL
jgi:hypothetical protein